MSENPDNIEYYSDPYEKAVELVILNTCSFISSGREEMFQTMEKLLSKLPYKTLATTSGLGWIGRSALFVCEEYGSAVALSAVLTDMPLKTGNAITDSFCDECEECQKACPVDAINPKKWNSRLNRGDIIDIETCSQYVIDQYKFGLGCSKCLSNCKLTQEYFKNTLKI